MPSNTKMAKPSSHPNHLNRKSGCFGAAAGGAAGLGCPGEEVEAGAAAVGGCADGLLGGTVGVGVVTVALRVQSLQTRVAVLALLV